MIMVNSEITDEDNTFTRTNKRSRNVMFNFDDEQERKKQKCNDDMNVHENVDEKWFYPSTWYKKSKHKIQNIFSRFMHK
jgi:hypothetical protein